MITFWLDVNPNRKAARIRRWGELVRNLAERLHDIVPARDPPAMSLNGGSSRINVTDKKILDRSFEPAPPVGVNGIGDALRLNGTSTCYDLDHKVSSLALGYASLRAQ